MATTQRLPLREQKHLIVRDEILRAASSLFAARGYRAVTIDDIAEEIGLTKSAMYYYFKNKYDLLSTIFHESFTLYLVQARKIAAEGIKADETLRSLVRRHVLNAIEMREWTTIFFREQSELDDKDRAFVAKCSKEYSDLFALAYSKGVRVGIFRDLPAVLVVNYIVAACNSVTLWLRDDGSLGADQVADLITQIVESSFREGSAAS
jgi:AcrR family transcriptional regulator